MKKLKSLEIKGLFDLHDYKVDFEKKNGYAIFAAPNGYGKSTILQIIRAVFSGNPFYFSTLKFSEIEMVFGNSDNSEESVLSIKKNIIKDHNDFPDLDGEELVVYAKNIDYTIDFICGEKKFSFTSDDIYKIEDIIDDKVDELDNATVDTPEQLNPVWMYKWDKLEEFPLLDVSDVFYRYNDVFKDSLPWLDEFESLLKKDYLFVSPNHTITFGKRSVKVRLDDLRSILYNKAERLQEDRESGYNYVSPIPESTPDMDQKALYDIVDGLCSELASVDVRFHKYNGSHLQDLHNAYEPFGLAFNVPFETDTVEQLREKENSLRARLRYIHTFDELIEKMELFEQTANKLLSFKKVRITFGDFWINVRETFLRLQANKISTGEEHLLLLIGYILFEATDKNSLVLMDEPETSLHPSWQEALSDFCWEVHKKYGVNFVFATHSPTFVCDRWKNVIELSHL